ncbi:hypothetical protein EB72_24845 [Mycobacterium sp. SWH-M1]|nr:hypothetical protein EB72_24845 [Mycobacterium sp. SWH-M1]
MPPRYDLRIPDNDHDPLRNQLNFDDPLAAIRDGAEQAGGQIRNVFEGLLSGVTDVINDLTGLDFSSWENFVASLRDGKGIDILTIPELVGNVAEIFGTITEIATSFAQMLLRFFRIDDLIAALTGKDDGDTTDVGDVIGNIFTGIGSTINAIVNGLLGWVGFDWTHEDAEQALRDEANTLAALNAAVQALQNDQNNQNVGGKAAVVDFTQRLDQTGMGTDFDIAYSGSGTSYLAIQSGDVVMVVGNNDPRTASFRYNALETATDYQRVGIAFSSAPERGFSNPARNSIHCRKNSAGTTHIYADLYKDSVELGCVVTGSKTIFNTTTDFSFKANAIYWLEAGTVGGLRIFRVLEGNTPVLVHTEVGTTSQVGAGFRGTGGGSYIYGNGFGFHNRPGSMLAFAMGDNQPPTVVGSGAIITRTSTAAVNISAGLNVVPTNFWGTPAETTSDLSIDYVNGRIQVSITGWYDVELRYAFDEISSSGASGGSTSPFPVHLAVFKGTGTGSPSLLRYIGDTVRTYYTGGPSGGTNATATWRGPLAAAGKARVFLQAGEYIQAGYNADAARTGFFLSNGAGTDSYLSLTLANRSLA